MTDERYDAEIDLAEIEVGARQRSLHEPTVDQLAKDMAKRALLQRIGVRKRDDKFDLIWGRHRLIAAEKLKWKTIPAVVFPAETTDDQALLLEIVENLRRRELSTKQKVAHTARLGALLKRQAGETLNDSDFPKTGRGHKGVTQKVAEAANVDQGTVRHRMKKVSDAIGEPVNLDTDSAVELERKADAYEASQQPKKMTRTHKPKGATGSKGWQRFATPDAGKWVHTGTGIDAQHLRWYYDTLDEHKKRQCIDQLKVIRGVIDQVISEVEGAA